MGDHSFFSFSQIHSPCSPLFLFYSFYYLAKQKEEETKDKEEETKEKVSAMGGIILFSFYSNTLTILSPFSFLFFLLSCQTKGGG